MRPRPAMLLAIAAIALLAAAPFWAADFTITLLNYIGIYALVALGIVLLTGVRRADVIRPGRVRRHRRLCHRLADDGRKALRPGSGFYLRLALTGAGRGASRRGHFAAGRTLSSARHHRLGTVDLFSVRQSSMRSAAITASTDVPPISIGSVSLEPTTAIYYLIWGMLIAATILVANLLESREGRAIRSLRGGVVMVESLGISVFRIRLITFVIAALLAGTLGLALCAYEPLRQPDAVRPAHGHPVSIHGDPRRIGAYPRRRGRRSAGHPACKMPCKTCCRISPATASNWKSIVFAIIYVLALQFARGGVMPFVLRFICPARRTRRLPPPRRCRDGRCREAGTPLLTVERLHQTFRRPRSRQPGRFRRQGRRDRRPDRTERRRQEHGVQSHHRRTAERRRQNLLSWGGHHPRRPAAHRRSRHRPHLPAREIAAEHVADRQRAARHISADPRGLSRRRVAA